MKERGTIDERRDIRKEVAKRAIGRRQRRRKALG